MNTNESKYEKIDHLSKGFLAGMSLSAMILTTMTTGLALSSVLIFLALGGSLGILAVGIAESSHAK
jgi:hypothetical protein